jgi:hypothetical protein
MEAVAMHVIAIGSVLFLVGLVLVAALCHQALRHGAEIEMGIKAPSLGLWVRLRPAGSPASTECEERSSGRSTSQDLSFGSGWTNGGNAPSVES